MQTIVLLLAIFAFASAAASSEWNSTLVRWTRQQDDPDRLLSFFKTPSTQDAAISAGWIESKGGNSLGLAVYCMEDDPRVCILYDGSGSRVGFQVGFLISELEPMQHKYNLSRIDAYKKAKVLDYDVWITTIYITNPGMYRKKEINYDIRTDEGIWIETTNGYVEVPKNLTDLDSIWVQQTCIPTQGTHYFYNMSPNLHCEDIVPWFLLYDDGKLVGGGLMGFGEISIGNRNWYEPLLAPLLYTIPDSPECLSDWIDEENLIFMHFFLIEEPWHATC